MSNYFGNVLPTSLVSNELFGAAAAAAVNTAMTSGSSSSSSSSSMLMSSSPQHNTNNQALSQVQCHESMHQRAQTLQMAPIQFLNSAIGEQMNSNASQLHYLQANSYENGFNGRYYVKPEHSTNFQSAMNNLNLTSPIQQNQINTTSNAVSSNLMCSSNSNSSQFASTSSSSSPDYMNAYKMGAAAAAESNNVHLQNSHVIHSSSTQMHHQQQQQQMSHQMAQSNHMQTPTGMNSNLTPHQSFNSSGSLAQNVSMNQMSSSMIYPWMRSTTNIKSNSILYF